MAAVRWRSAVAHGLRRHLQVSHQVADRCKSLQAKQQLRDSFNGTHSSESFSHSGTHSQLPWLVPVVLIAMRFPKQRYLALLPRCQLGCQPAGIFTLPRCQPIDLASWLTFERGPSIYLLQQLTLLLHSLPMHSRMIHAFC